MYPKHKGGRYVNIPLFAMANGSKSYNEQAKQSQFVQNQKFTIYSFANNLTANQICWSNNGWW